MKEKILVSACLLGEPCRYDGRSVPCEGVLTLNEKYDFVTVCPEVAGGLSTPRIPSERLFSRVVNKSGEDVSENYNMGAKFALDLCRKHGIKLAILKERSPSCGSNMIYDGTFSGKLISGNGVTASLLKENGIRVISEAEIDSL